MLISPMLNRDASDVARLSAQLGYPATAEEIRKNLEAMRMAENHEILVVRESMQGSVVGWIHVYEHLSIATGPRCEVGGLVVDEAKRGLGIGTKLLRAAEDWAKSRGCPGVRFSSRITRTEAHRLYERLGYRVQKTSHVFSKDLG